MSSDDSSSSEAESSSSSYSADDPSHDTAGAKIWSVYVSEAEKYDKALVDSWKSDMDGLLIFAGLFSAILTAFLIESYKTLTPDSGDDMKSLLTQISTQLSGIANGSSVSLPVAESFVPPTWSLVCNLLWFISLGLSLSCALIATLVEQWARDFKYKTEMRSAPVIRARIYSYLYSGLKRFNMHAVVEIIPFLLHASLILFFTGLVAFLVPVNKAVMISVIILLGIMVIAYTTLTVFPLFSCQSPYQTPLSTGLWRAIQLTRSIWRSASKRHTLPTSRVDAMNKAALEDSAQRSQRDYHALAWTLGSVSDDDELEPFLEGIVHALASTEYYRSPYGELIGRLLQSRDSRLLQRVDDFLYRCESKILLLETQTRRQLIALKCLWAMAAIPAKEFTNHLDPVKLVSLRLDHFDFSILVTDSNGRPPVVHEHQLSVHAMLRLNVLITALCTVHNTVRFLSDGRRSSHEEIPHLLTNVPPQSVQELFPPHILEPLHALLDSPLWKDYHLARFGDQLSMDMLDILPLKNCIRQDLPRHSAARRLWLDECLASLECLRQQLIRMGHEYFSDFMICAARLGSPPYEFHRTHLMLSRYLLRPEAVAPITAIYLTACNAVIYYQCHEHTSYQPQVDSILATLLERLGQFQKISPNPDGPLPENLNLSLYLSKSYFDRSESRVLLACGPWWMCSCLTSELATKSPHVRSESAELILRAMWEVVAKMGDVDMTRVEVRDVRTAIAQSQCMLEALRGITDYPETVSLIALTQMAILCQGLFAQDPTSSRFGKHVENLTRFIDQASTLDSPPYKMEETMTRLMGFWPSGGPNAVNPPQQLNFAKSWKAALEHDSPQGFATAIVEIISTCRLLEGYGDEGYARFRWLDDCEAARIFVEGIDIAERRENISAISRTRLAAIRESLMTVVDVQETQILATGTDS
ncbi:hypothetical protein R3P38DRAFT_3207468 [Favolaschia claudopus]|uniref:DUF6535 domain-containing protein n=1 Tax=Favolaschia claudopus TaxID=2862362 RepID=A0AAW0AJH2_9AGAR